MVVNAKLERLLDSHAPQTKQLYTCEDYDWGKTYENEYEDQWEASDEQQYEAQENTQQKRMTKKIMQRMSKAHNHTVIILMKMIAIATCDIRISRKQRMHTYQKHRLCHVTVWTSSS